MNEQNEAPKPMSDEERTRYLLSFLAIHIEREHEGRLLIKNLSEFAGKFLLVDMKIQPEHDRVVLKTRVSDEMPTA